jgi:histidine triad (HIT) family protein
MACIFCDFINGKKKDHGNGLPFIALNETKNTISFLSIDCPAREEDHVLVVPKKHYSKLESVPIKIQHELIEHISLISKTLRKRHLACNVLLNNGKQAGQYIQHTHFHIIPRDKKDGIKIEVWKKKHISLEKFIRINNNLKMQIKKAKNERKNRSH